MNWTEISVLTEVKCVEAIAGIFHRLGSDGVVIEDHQTCRQHIEKNEWDPSSVSPDFLNHEFVAVKAYFLEEEDVMEELMQSLERVKVNFDVECQVFIDEVKNEDWETSWKDYYHTFKVGERLLIKPSWEEYTPEHDEIIIEIDPGMAFGTGIHASTRFCLMFVDEYVKGGEKIIDAGCGSGILSIAAARLGASNIKAMDIDDIAVKIASENIALNHLQDKIDVRCGDMLEQINVMEADMILANITSDVIEMLIPRAAEILSAGGYFFGSGILDIRWPAVKKQLESHGFLIEKVLTETDWVGVAAVKV